MKNVLSLIACIIIGVVLVQYRVSNSDMRSDKVLKVTEWDAFGYYVYLPAIAIYDDYKELKWLPEIDKKYAVTGGNGIQAEKLENGNYTFKYLGGVAIMEIPFFITAHWIAKHYNYPPDGFSPPYQYMLGFGVIFYCILAILLLRKILLYYFSDLSTAITLLLLCLATNFIQYAAVDNGQSHGYIFPLYALIIFTTLKWHNRPGVIWAALTGYILGLATISRPTEAIMLFIPLLWNTHTKEAAKQKWQQVRDHKSHIAIACIFGLLGILPQLIYWKLSTGSFIFDVGSKWDFLNPHFRVLFGWEKGWFIYTPVTVFFIIGLYFIKPFPFRKSALWFCLLNIYIIIAWHDWRYGGSYSTRALVQGYPVFALPLCAFVDRLRFNKWRVAFYILGAYLLAVNLFQIVQYNTTVLHYNDMNNKYYGRIYLNPRPTPLDMSLLDNDEVLNSETGYAQKIAARADTVREVKFDANTSHGLTEFTLADTVVSKRTDTWLKIAAAINAPTSLWQSYLNAEVQVGDSIKQARVRLFSPISKKELTNSYVFYMSIPEYFRTGRVKVYISSPFTFEGRLEQFSVISLKRQH